MSEDLNIPVEAEASATGDSTLLSVKQTVREMQGLNSQQREALVAMFHNLYCLAFAEGAMKVGKHILADFRQLLK